MAFCGSCGTEHSGGSFCAACGAPLKALNGQAVAKNKSVPQGEEELLAAADSGDLQAMYDLGLLNEAEGDLQASAKWMAQASNGGMAAASFHVARYLHEHNREELADSWFEKAIEQGSQDAREYPRNRHFDEDGALKLDELLESDVVTIRDEIQNFVSSKLAEWQATYGPLEALEQSELGADGVKARLDQTSDNLVWADANFWEGSEVSPARGLDLNVNGWARLPGRSNYAVAADAEDFFVATTPWEGNPYEIELVYTFMQCGCPFCAESGERDGEECPACDGEGVMEFDA